MDEEGYQVTARHHWAGKEGFIVSEVIKENGKYQVNKKVYRNYDKEELKRKIKEIVYRKKQSKQKYKRCYTISEYENLKNNLSSSVYFY